MKFIPCWVFPARSSWTSGCSGSRPQILGCSGFLRLWSSRCRPWQSAVSLTPPSPLHTDCRLAGWCWSVLEQLEVISSGPPERAAALRGLNSNLTSCFFHHAGQKLLLIGCCLSVSPVIGQIQLHMSAGVVLHLCLCQSPAATLVVLPFRIRLCRASPSDQSRTPPAGRPALLHLEENTTAQVRRMKVTVSLRHLISLKKTVHVLTLLSSVISPRSQVWFLLSLKEQLPQNLNSVISSMLMKVRVVSTEQFWSFTVKQSCSILPNNWGSWDLKHQMSPRSSSAEISVCRSDEITTF